MWKGLWCLVIAVSVGAGWHLGRPTQSSQHQTGAERAGERGSLLSERQAMERSVSRLVQVPAESLMERLEKALDESKTGATFEIQLLLARAYQEDREGLRLWVLRHRREVLGTVVRLWLRESPEDIWIEGRYSSRDTWDRAMTKALAAEDPARFFELYAENRHLKDGGSVILEATQSLAKRDFERAEKIVAGIANVPEATRAMIGLSRAKVQKASFREVYAWASSLERDAETALAVMMDSLSKTDVERAVALFSESGLADMTSLPDEARKQTRSALMRLPAEEVATLLKAHPVKSFEGLGTRELPSDPLEAAAVLGERESIDYYWEPKIEREALVTTLNELVAQTDSIPCQRVLRMTLMKQSKVNPDMVVDWISDLPESDIRRALALRAIRSIAYDYFPQLVNSVELDDQGERDHVKSHVRHVTQRMARQSPLGAFRIASQIDDAELRSSALDQLEETWKEYDEMASMETLQLEQESEIRPID